MSRLSQEDSCRLDHCIYEIILNEPRIHFYEGAKRCGIARNTFTGHWYDGLMNQVFFPVQIRLKVFEDRKEYIYLVQSDTPHRLFQYYRNHPSVIYTAYTLGKFDLFIQTNEPLEIVPNNTILCGSRGDYLYPKTPYCDYETALNKMETFLDQSHTPSSFEVSYSKKPDVKGEKYGMELYPLLKYDLRPNYTKIVKKLGISFASFYKGLEYLLNMSKVLLPFYPLGFPMYREHFFVFWTDYESTISKFFSFLPCHVSIVKVDDCLVVYASIQEGKNFKERFFDICYKMLEEELINRFWTAIPVRYWIPDP